MFLKGKTVQGSAVERDWGDGEGVQLETSVHVDWTKSTNLDANITEPKNIRAEKYMKIYICILHNIQVSEIPEMMRVQRSVPAREHASRSVALMECSSPFPCSWRRRNSH